MAPIIGFLLAILGLLVLGGVASAFKSRNHGLSGGSKNQKLGVIGLIVMLLGILGLSNYVKNLNNLL